MMFTRCQKAAEHKHYIRHSLATRAHSRIVLHTLTSGSTPVMQNHSTFMIMTLRQVFIFRRNIHYVDDIFPLLQRKQQQQQQPNTQIVSHSFARIKKSSTFYT